MGFRFSAKGIEKELETVVGLSDLINTRTGEQPMKEMEQIIEKYKQAGIDKIIAEWNRQFAEWEKERR